MNKRGVGIIVNFYNVLNFSNSLQKNPLPNPVKVIKI